MSTLIDAIDIPVAGSGAKARLNVFYFFNWLRKWGPDRAFIERAGSMPGQGSSSGFRYGRVTGALETTVVLAGVPLVVVEPAVWKRTLGLPGANAAGSVAAAKEEARQRALQTWPERADLLALRKAHGRAEAALLALYGATHALEPREPAKAPLPLFAG